MRSLFLALSLSISGALSAQTQVCLVQDAGNSCGPVLSVTFTPIGGGANMLDLHATGLHPSALCGMIWGLNPVNVPVIPGSSCLLLTDYVWGHSMMSDSLGEASWQRSWPVSYEGYFYMQMGSVVATNGGIDVLTTSCKRASCDLQ